MAMLCEYDLRTFVIVDPVNIFYRYDFKLVEEVEDALSYLVNTGILEPGPRVNCCATYRIRPQFLLSNVQIKQLEQEREARTEREKLRPVFGIWPQR